MTLPGNRKLVPTPGFQRVTSDAQLAGFELTDGQALPVSNADEARLRYNLATNRVEVSVSGGAWTLVAVGDIPGLVDDAAAGTINPYSAGVTGLFGSDGATVGGLWLPHTVATLAALGLVPSADLPNSTRAYVYEPGIEDVYVLDTVGVHTVTGDSVIAAADGGYWVSRMDGRWDDLQGTVSQGTAVGALTYENYRDTVFKLNFFRHDQNDELSKGYQLPHRWKYNTTVYPHIHVLPVADPAVAQVAYFDGYYCWSTDGATAMPALVGWTPFNASLTINPGDVYRQKRLTLAAVVPPVDARESSLLNIYMRRFGTDGADTYNTNKVGGTVAANLALLSVDVHYQVRWMGTTQQTVSP